MRNIIKNNRTITLRFRETETELKYLKAKLQKTKYKTYSEYVRSKTIGKVRSVNSSLTN